MPIRLPTKWTVACGLLCFAALVTGMASAVRAQATQPAAPTTEPASIFDNAGNATNIAFVCDSGGGSWIQKLATLKRELNKSLGALHPNQQFSITFIEGRGGPNYIDKNLILATPENKRKAEDFLEDVEPGMSDGIPGLDIAFKQHPQLLYLLTDGDFNDNAAVLAEIHKLDPNHKIRINTIAFTGSSDHDIEFEKLLKKIAAEYGGTYKQVNEEDLDEGN